MPRWDIWYAALLTRMSSPPSVCTHWSTMRRQRCSSWMSPASEAAVRPDFPDETIGLACVLLLGLEVRDHHVRTLARERQRDGTTAARVAAGDQRAFALSFSLPLYVFSP
jgi:hypothetical protein